MVNTQLPAVFVPVKPLPADTVPADTVPVTVRLLSEPTEVNEELTTVGFRVFPVSVPAAAEEIGQIVPFALHTFCPATVIVVSAEMFAASKLPSCAVPMVEPTPSLFALV